MTKNILITAYDVNPYKGSESATGWNFPINIAKFCDYNITVITRENNKPAIEQYFKDNPEELRKNLRFEYFDLPYRYRFWKRGARGAVLYYYLWQYFVINKVKSLGKFDIYHALNFHTDSFPSFLWKLSGSFVWGPISHHEPIPSKFLGYYPRKESLKEYIRAVIKNTLWKFDPFLKVCAQASQITFVGHSKVASRLSLGQGKQIRLNQVASEFNVLSDCDLERKGNEKFQFVTIGRCVPLKGFDLLIDAFNIVEQKVCNISECPDCELVIIGDGPYLDAYKKQAESCHGIQFTGWVSHNEVYHYLAKSDAFVFPSHEGAGMVVAEAASFGLPIICLDNYGPGELLPIDYSLKVNCNGTRNEIVNKLAEKMLILLCEHNERELLAKEIEMHFLRTMTWQAKAKQVINAYESIL